MKRLIILSIIGFNILFTISCSNQRIDESIRFTEFQNPSAKYRSIPFYSLNDKLDANELKRQLIEFKKGGFGGSYLHSRIGLLTEYLGEEWWQAMDAGVRVSDSLGIEAWFYDEDKWPSGFAGGIIPRMSEDFHAHALVRIPVGDNIPKTGTILFSDDQYNYVDYKSEMGQAWYNGTCWVDLMNPNMVKAFIDTSYVPYARRYKSYFGKSAFGMFTDEPQIGPQTNIIGFKETVSFSPFILDRFEKEHAYSIIEHLPSLFDTVGNYRKIRIDYYRTIANQYEESFSKQIGDFCEKNNMIFTGHYFEEQSPAANLRNGGNLAIQYRHQQQPGIDHLFLRIKDDLHGAKQMTSVANQYGMKRRLSEAFGVSGQNMSFEDRKWIVDWHGLMGINHMCPHLSLYSMKGERKRDYPPTISPQQPWWKYNKTFEDYSARICYINTLGQQSADVLVIAPLESAILDMDVANFQWRTERDNQYRSFLEKMMQQHVTFDIGDEQILADTAFVHNNELVVGNMQYKTIILPYMQTIRATTLKLIDALNKNGVETYFVGEKPIFVDGEKDENSLAILNDVKEIDINDIAQNITNLSDEMLINGDSTHLIWMSKRKLKGGAIFQLSNTSRLNTIDCKIIVKGENLVLWDPSKASCFRINSSNTIRFAPAQTYFISSGTASSDAQIEGKYTLPPKEVNELKLATEWEGKRLNPNALTLDFASYITETDKAFLEPEPVIGIHKRLEKQQYNGSLCLLFSVEIDKLPENCSLVLEQPEMYDMITVNGKKLSFDGKAFYRDHTFKMTAITPFLDKGKNHIQLKLNYEAPIANSYDPYERYGTEIESIYLVGDFGVFAKTMVDTENFETEKNSKKEFKTEDIHRLTEFYISEEKEKFSGSLVTSGYPFFNGDFMLTQKFVLDGRAANKRYLLPMDSINATVINVTINGTSYEPVAWSPWSIDVTDALKEGTNTITLTLTNSLRNLLGPHHHIGGELVGVGPYSFTGARSWTSPLKGENDWYDRRKNKQSTNIWTDDYFFVPFGMDK